jgi:hypothetical protein
LPNIRLVWPISLGTASLKDTSKHD